MPVTSQDIGQNLCRQQFLFAPHHDVFKRVIQFVIALRR